MRFPLKINRNAVPVWVGKLLPSKDDPRILCDPDIHVDSFEKLISSVKIGTTWKSTKKNRHPITNQLIIEFASRFPGISILDVGVSSGSTSLDLLNQLGNNFHRYYVTDLFFSLPYHVAGSTYFFYHPSSKHCIMRVSDCWIMYEDVTDAIFPLSLIVRSALNKAPKFDMSTVASMSMLHPALKNRISSDNRIIPQEYDIFTTWPNDPVDIVKVCNVLNRLYFTDDELSFAIANLCAAIKPGGRLVITDNRKLEKVSIYSKDSVGVLHLTEEKNGGTEIADLILPGRNG